MRDVVFDVPAYASTGTYRYALVEVLLISVFKLTDMQLNVQIFM